MGKKNSYEKTVVLSIAKKLAKKLKKHGLDVYLTRSSDYYVPLRKRFEKAEKVGAKVFISIHADASHNRKAQGASVYTLSSKGASSELARLLAKKENSADLLGGVFIGNKSARRIIGNVQKNRGKLSDKLGSEIIQNLRQERIKMHKLDVQKAAFVVLKSPRMVSVLVETGFISNSLEEKKLSQKDHQEKIVRALSRSIVKFNKANPL